MSNILLFRRRHPDPSTGVADDGIHYVRPAGGSYGAEDGSTYANAWNGFTNIAWGAGVGQVGPGDTLNAGGVFGGGLTVGGSGTSGSSIIIRGDAAEEAGTIQNYTTSTTTGDWTEVSAADPTSPSPGSNFWVIDIGTSLNNVGSVWFGSGFQRGANVRYWTANTTTVTDVTAGNVPASDYEFDFFRGSGPNTTLIGVYASGNPVTYYSEVHYASDNENRGILLQNKEYITIQNITVSKCGEAIRLQNTSDSTTMDSVVVDNVTVSDTTYAVQNSGGGTNRLIDLEVKNCSISDTSGPGIYLRGHNVGNTVHDNTFTRCGWGRSQGGIYTSVDATAGEILIYGNTFDSCYSGRYWASDGGGVDTDSGTKNIKQYQNYYRNLWQAWHDNSGGDNWFYLNIMDGCSMLSQHTDSGALGGLEAYIYHNVGTGFTGDTTYNDSSQDLNSVLRVGNVTAGADGVNVKNNIFIGATGAEDCLMRADGLVVSSDWHEDYNCIWGVGNEVVDLSSNAESQGANRVNVNPFLDANYRPTNALLVGAGIAVAGITTDYDGNTFSDPPTIGAFEMEGLLGGYLWWLDRRRRAA